MQSLTVSLSNLQITFLPLVIACGFMFTFKMMNPALTDITHSVSCKSSGQLFPRRAGVRPCWVGGGSPSEWNEILVLFPCQCQNMHGAATAFKCIWSKRAGMPNLASARSEGRREERRLACHCIIPTAINSLCPEAEWTHHSNGHRQSDTGQLSISPRLLPATPADLNKLEKATGV